MEVWRLDNAIMPTDEWKGIFSKVPPAKIDVYYIIPTPDELYIL